VVPLVHPGRGQDPRGGLQQLVEIAIRIHSLKLHSPGGRRLRRTPDPGPAAVAAPVLGQRPQPDLAWPGGTGAHGPRRPGTRTNPGRSRGRLHLRVAGLRGRTRRAAPRAPPAPQRVPTETGADLVYPWFEITVGLDPFPHLFGKEWDPAASTQTTITFLVRKLNATGRLLFTTNGNIGSLYPEHFSWAPNQCQMILITSAPSPFHCSLVVHRPSDLGSCLFLAGFAR
jgi:hypothetical protein